MDKVSGSNSVTRLRMEVASLMEDKGKLRNELELFRDKVAALDRLLKNETARKENIEFDRDHTNRKMERLEAKYVLLLELYCSQNRIELKNITYKSQVGESGFGRKSMEIYMPPEESRR